MKYGLGVAKIMFEQLPDDDTKKVVMSTINRLLDDRWYEEIREFSYEGSSF
jgi:phage terminase large subunit